jgi:predicted kinase
LFEGKRVLADASFREESWRRHALEELFRRGLHVI